jgi:hypothetical protein
VNSSRLTAPKSPTRHREPRPMKRRDGGCRTWDGRFAPSHPRLRPISGRRDCADCSSPAGDTCRYRVCRVIPSSWQSSLTFVSGLPIDAMASRTFAGVILKGRPPFRPRARADARLARVRSEASPRGAGSGHPDPRGAHRDGGLRAVPAADGACGRSGATILERRPALPKLWSPNQTMTERRLQTVLVRKHCLEPDCGPWNHIRRR